MNKIILFLFSLILFSSFVFAIDTSTNIGYWSMDRSNVTGISVIDLSSSGYNGVVSGVVGNQTGIINDSYLWNGDSDRINLGAGIRYDNSDGTINFWYNLDSNVNVPRLFGDRSSSTFDYINAYQNVNDISVVLRDGGTNYQVDALGVADTGVWHMLTFTWGSSGMKLYIDGVLKDSDAFTGTWGSTTDFWIGNTVQYPTYEMDGYIDEFSIWDVQLTQVNITELNNSGLGFNPYAVSVVNVSYFSISADSFWDGGSISSFNASINGVDYVTTNGTINTLFNQSIGNLTNITVWADDRFNVSYVDYNSSVDLVVIMKQTDIVFNFLFSSGDLIVTPINLTRIDTNFSFNVTGGSINIFPDSGLNYFTARCDNEIFAPFDINLSFSDLENSSYNFSVNETQTVLTFLDENTSSPIENATVYITFPSGNSTSRVTNSSGQINFSYIYNNTLEFGSYNFIFSKVGYINLSFSEEINVSVIPFSKTYNISRAKLNIYIYDRVTRNLLSGINVSVAFIGLFNETTDNGMVLKDNLTIMGGDYLVYASADDYKTSVRSLTFTNQEEFTLNFYLLNLSYPSYGNLFVTTFDSFYRTISGAKVELLEYVPSSLSYVSVAECVSNIDAQCSFGVELNTKVYYIRATAIINGVLLVAETNQNGEIFTFDGDNRDLVFYTSTSFQVEPSTSLIYEISETFISNISSISNSFYSLDGNAYTVCIEYFREDVSVTGDTYCLSSTSALQNIDANMLLNRSFNYRAEIYIKTSNGNILLDKYVYPSSSGIRDVLGDSVVGAIIIVLWILALGFCVYSKNMVFWFAVSLVLAWLQVIFFPLNSIVSFAVFKSLISILCLLVARKKRDLQ